VTSIGHNITGASIGLACYSWIDRPILAFISAVIAGFISHYVFDFIPHGHYKDVGTRKSDGSLIEIDKKTLIFVLLDAIPSLIAINLAVFFMSDSLWTTFIVASAIAAAQLPDAIEFFIDIGFIKKSKFLAKHRNFHMFEPIHWHSPSPAVARVWTWTDIWQLIPLAVLIWQIISL